MPRTSASPCSPTTTARSAGGWPARWSTASTTSTVTASGDGAVTLDEGLARFDCTVYREVEAGDHTIVILLLHAVETLPEGGDTSLPLVFHRSAFGRLSEPA